MNHIPVQKHLQSSAADSMEQVGDKKYKAV
jgi:hypothetical protein